MVWVNHLKRWMMVYQLLDSGEFIMTNEYHVKLIQDGNTQTLPIPQELNLLTSEVIIRKEAGKLIIEPYKKQSLLEVLATLEDSEEDIDLSDEDLLPLDDIEI